MNGLVAGLMAAGYCAECSEAMAAWIERHAELLVELLLFFDSEPQAVACERGGRLHARAVAETRRMMGCK